MSSKRETGQAKDGQRTAAVKGRSVALLNPESRLPLYHQIFLILRNRIYGGEIAPGNLVPGEQDLAVEFNVSRITAKRALNELAEAGLVVRERGRGTRVIHRPPAPAVASSIEGWLENVTLMGSATQARVLEFDHVPANEDVAHALEIAPGEDVQHAVRVRWLDGEPMSYLTTYVPGDIGRQFGREDLDAQPLLRLLEGAGIEVASARQQVSAVVADTAVANALSIQAGSPLLEVLRVVRDVSGRPVEYLRVLYRPDVYRFDMSMRRVREKEGMRWATLTSSGVPTAD
ncbi:GntR family transcriptional regulator [Breoghania sp.]|uniref:GntR family transcriptional regulator n=1 Tax=Breoghania sp. TaxID=2065378 RepID=UPI002AA8B2DD|nr:GntR family transcriptional regulator [Breoghania sp.]